MGPSNIYLIEVSNRLMVTNFLFDNRNYNSFKRNTRKWCEICCGRNIRKRCEIWTYFRAFFSVSIVHYEQINICQDFLFCANIITQSLKMSRCFKIAQIFSVNKFYRYLNEWIAIEFFKRLNYKDLENKYLSIILRKI